RLPAIHGGGTDSIQRLVNTLPSRTPVTSLVLSGGSLTITGTTLPSQIDGILTVSGSGILDGAATLNVNGGLDWTGGTLQGTGLTVILTPGILNIHDAASKRLDRALTNNGSASWSG